MGGFDRERLQAAAEALDVALGKTEHQEDATRLRTQLGDLLAKASAGKLMAPLNKVPGGRLVTDSPLDRDPVVSPAWTEFSLTARAYDSDLSNATGRLYQDRNG